MTIKSSSSQSKLLVNLIPDIVAEVDINKVYTWLNDAGYKFFGKEVIGKEASFYFEGQQDTYKKVAPLFKGEEGVFYVESWQYRKDGEKRLLAWRCHVLKDENKKIIGAISVARDVTDSYDLEVKNKQNEMQLDNALRLAHLGPWEYDVEKDLFTFNDSFYAIFKTNAKKEGGYKMSSAEYAKRFVHPDDASIVGAEVEKSIKSEEDYFVRQLEHRIVYANGEQGYIIVCFFAIKNEEGKTIKTFGINQDITEFKNREEKLVKIKEELQVKIEELEGFNKIVVDRELKMIKLKNRIKKLEDELSLYKK